MRLIDADALKEKVEAIVFGCNLMGDEYQCRLSDTIDYIADVLIEGAPTMGSWILCSEKLPEMCGKYLVTVKWSNDNENEHIYITTSWYKEWDDVGWDWSEFNVIAWQPLPKPYHTNTKRR